MMRMASHVPAPLFSLMLAVLESLTIDHIAAWLVDERWLKVAATRLLKAIGNVLLVCLGAYAAIICHAISILTIGEDAVTESGIAGLAERPFDKRSHAERKWQDLRGREMSRWGRQASWASAPLPSSEELPALPAPRHAVAVPQSVQRLSGLLTTCTNALRLSKPVVASVSSSPLWRILPPELVTIILLHAASPSAEQPMPLTVSLVSKIHARLVRARLYTHLVLSSPRSTRAARLTMAIHNPALGTLVRTAHLTSNHASATEQLLLACPNLQALALSVAAHDALAVSPGTRLVTGAKPRLLYLACLPVALSLFSKVQHACLTLRSLDERGAELLFSALPALRTLEIYLKPSQIVEEEEAEVEAWVPHLRARRESVALAAATRYLTLHGQALQSLTIRTLSRDFDARNCRLQEAFTESQAASFLSTRWMCVGANGEELEQHAELASAMPQAGLLLPHLRILGDSTSTSSIEQWSTSRSEASWNR